MNIFPIKSLGKPIMVILDPWAKPYRLEPGTVMELHQPDDLEGHYLVLERPNDDLHLVAEGEYRFPKVVFKKG